MIRTPFRSSLCWQQPPFVLFSDSPSALRSCRSCILLVHGAPIRCMSSCNVRSGTTDTGVRWFSAANVRVNPSRSPGEMQEAVLCNVKLSALSDHLDITERWTPDQPALFFLFTFCLTSHLIWNRLHKDKKIRYGTYFAICSVVPYKYNTVNFSYVSIMILSCSEGIRRHSHLTMYRWCIAAEGL